ncbi:MAG: hypothetical protein FWE01_01050, partial [Firmicutes bacterium]|nr:hypothetical protein [Bacillota bacterium]
MKKHSDKEKQKYYLERMNNPNLTRGEHDFAKRRLEQLLQKDSQSRPCSEIRFNKKTKHKSWLFEKQGNMRKSAGLTHSKWHNNKKNIPLPDNPQLNDFNKNGNIRKSYFNSEEQYQHHRTYGNKNYLEQDNHQMTKRSKKTILGFFRRKKP